jgi:subtilisin family serine protease
MVIPAPRRFLWMVTLLLVAGAAVRPPAVGGAAEPTLTPLSVDDPAVTSGLAWHLDAIGARAAWRASLGASVTVAVVDTGVDHTHPDLTGQVRGRATCLGTAGDVDRCTGGAPDSDGHGTHVAGLIAARADDGFGVAGVAPRARLLAVRAAVRACAPEADCLASADPADLAAGIRWSVDQGADIVNLSIDPGRRVPAVLVEAIDAAWAAGSVVILAAGNTSSGPLLFATGAALLVTATDREGNRAPYAPSLDAARVAVAAPGGRSGDTRYTCHRTGRSVGVVSTFARSEGDGSGHACLAGTSMAAAQVSGGLALLLSMGFSRDEALERLVDTARPAPGLGDGLVDLATAVGEPHPVGVAFRHDAFDNGAAVAAPGEVPVVGPFAREATGGSDLPSVWWFMAGGALGLALLAEGALRVAGRRRAPPAAGHVVDP